MESICPPCHAIAPGPHFHFFFLESHGSTSENQDAGSIWREGTEDKDELQHSRGSSLDQGRNFLAPLIHLSS